MQQKVNFNVIEKIKNDNTDEIKKNIYNIVNKLMRNEFRKNID